MHQNLTFPVQPDPWSGMHCWLQKVTRRRRRTRRTGTATSWSTPASRARSTPSGWRKTRPGPERRRLAPAGVPHAAGQAEAQGVPRCQCLQCPERRWPGASEPRSRRSPSRRRLEAVVEPQLGLPLGELGHGGRRAGRPALGDACACRLHASRADPAPAERLRARVTAAVRLSDVARTRGRAGCMDGARWQAGQPSARPAPPPGRPRRQPHRLRGGGSGKGGVGKSTVTANLAAALALAGGTGGRRWTPTSGATRCPTVRRAPRRRSR